MIVPIAARDVAAAAGAVLVLGAVFSVVGTLIVPRKTGSRLTRLVAGAVSGIFRLIARPIAGYPQRDRILAGQAAVILIGQLAVWLVSFYVGYSLLIWPVTSNIGSAFTSVGPALWTFGSLNSRAGSPSWGPELLARTHYALGSGGLTTSRRHTRWPRRLTPSRPCGQARAGSP